jgi:O-antigen ligase
MIVTQGWNAWNINQLYLQRGFISINGFLWNFLDNNTYSISSLPVACVAFAVVMVSNRWWQRGLAGLIFVLQMHQLMILQSRGTMVGGLVVILLGILFMPKTRATILICVWGFIIGSVLAGPSVVEEFNSSFISTEELDSSAESRFKLWKAGASIMRDYPLLGVGPWAGQYLVPQYIEGYDEKKSSKALHNLFFEVGTGSGIPSLIAYLAFFSIPWWAHFQEWRHRRSTMEPWFRIANLAILCGVPGYWAASMFSSGALIEAPYVLIVLGCCALSIQENLPQLEGEDEEFEDDDRLQEAGSFEPLEDSAGQDVLT